MLAHEWRELESLCERIGALRERLAVACKTGNTGLVDGLTRRWTVRHGSASVWCGTSRRGSARPPPTARAPPDPRNAARRRAARWPVAIAALMPPPD